MITRITANQFVRRVTNGKTRPAILIGESDEGQFEVVTKLASGCERGATSLSIEALCALLAADLSVPIPRPFYVHLDNQWIDAVPDVEWAELARSSSRLAFGSKLLPNAYSTWVIGTKLTSAMAQTAANVLLFDAVIENVDRRASNPNCLVRGDQIRVFDHELAFPPLLIGVPRPWVIGALGYMETPGSHIFRDALVKQGVDWDPIIERWNQLSNDQLDDYEAAFPAEWDDSKAAYQTAIQKIKEVRDNIGECVVEVKRLLT